MRILEVIARWLFGLFYAFIGATWFVNHFSGKPTFTPNPDETEAARALAYAISESGFLNPVIAATCLIGGALLLTRRTTPIGILLLAPLVTIIFLFHICLNEPWFYWIWGAAQFLYLLALAWLHRKAFHSLFAYGR